MMRQTNNNDINIDDIFPTVLLIVQDPRCCRCRCGEVGGDPDPDNSDMLDSDNPAATNSGTLLYGYGGLNFLPLLQL